MSSSVILFNKYLLDTMGFSMCIPALWLQIMLTYHRIP